MSSVDRLAQMIAEMHKANRNPPSTAPRVGTVISVNPVRIQYGDGIILERRHLIIAESLMAGYTRTIELTTVTMEASDEDFPARITFYRSGGSTQERITRLDIPLPNDPESENNRVSAMITYTDGLLVGDKVIIQPDESLKLWYVLDRVWREPEE